jgi:ribosomal protein L11 methyltransferase
VIGDDLTVRFPWHDASLIKTSKELVLEGGAAFGTGDHPTTRLCCRWLQDVLKRKNDVSVLDYGCGSAILGLASLLYGARTAAGIDIDIDALRSAKNNCLLNKLHMDLYCTADVESPSSWPVSPNGVEKGDEDFRDISHLNGTFEITVANILAPILILLVEDIAKRTSQCGYVAMSGLVSQQSDAVINAYRGYFDNLKVHEEEEGWVLITGIRNTIPVGVLGCEI